MANPELGAKQICPHCQAKFYDLNKRPAHCPKCATEFDPDEAIRNRRVRARVVTPEAEVEEEREDQVVEPAEAEEEEEDVAAPELDEVVNEPPLVSDDEEEDGVEPVVSPVSEDLGEFTEDEDVEDDADVPFLEEDEDEFDDSEIEGLPGQDDE
ncbi:MAG TPA: TIGR02300 family protein [Phenylobacterium sp.]|uniref:TIGR02300 family protein n=1 Tax=Phenylobacterium sp. TaxID=1871053 RepID=UPI002C69A007|nr:TIGR02300 family protein [Phenylobacterium sp.]HSV04753.1 TIGR02300 family protein [Phenylobacterium sp.]